MMVRAPLVAGTVAFMLLLSVALPALGNPLAILLVAGVILGLTLVKDRRMAIGLAVAASVALVVIAWVAIQPSYVQAG